MIEISKEQAIKVMEENLKILKECSDSDTFLLLSFDLKENKSLGRNRVGLSHGKKLVTDSKTFVLNKDEEEDSVSVLSMYTALQKDIFNILPIGKKHDMIIIPQLEWCTIKRTRIFWEIYTVDKYKHMFYHIIMDTKKRKSSYRCWRTIMIRKTFSTHTYKFVVQKGLEFETQQKRCDITVECYALSLLHILF